MGKMHAIHLGQSSQCRGYGHSYLIYSRMIFKNCLPFCNHHSPLKDKLLPGSRLAVLEVVSLWNFSLRVPKSTLRSEEGEWWERVSYLVLPSLWLWRGWK